ncbi:MAG: hypothetical protein Q8P93_03360 [bacterium]|nr:hypothetical protein [bacterium]
MPQKQKKSLARKKTSSTDDKNVPAKKNVASGKKKTKVTKTKKRLPKVAEGTYCFYLNDGRVLSSLPELHEALCVMSDEQYAYHTTDRNDFASWVEHVLDEAETAAGLSKAPAREDAVRIIQETLTLYY